MQYLDGDRIERLVMDAVLEKAEDIVDKRRMADLHNLEAAVQNGVAKAFGK